MELWSQLIGKQIMTIKDLIKELRKLDENTIVYCNVTHFSGMPIVVSKHAPEKHAPENHAFLFYPDGKVLGLSKL